VSKELRNAVSSHRAVRLEIAVREDYDDFRSRFESAVPMWNRDRAADLIERRASWQDVVATAIAEAPYDFLLYSKLDLAPIMSLAGNRQRAVEYLMGNHVIAETMYRLDPGVALYVPLRCAIYESGAGTRFSIEQPSANLSSLGRDEITAVGIGLDRKLAKLLAVLNLDSPPALTESAAAAQ
jgi:hypothetical protein